MPRCLLSTCLLAALWLTASPARADLQAGLDAYYDGDYAAALQQLRPAAEAGDIIAQYFLGEMYLHGRGVARDFEKAAHWYERAGEYGHPQAQAALGSLQLLGLGTPRQPSSGYFWLILSVVWQDGELRGDALWALGEVAGQLSPEQKRAVAAQALPAWRRQ